MGRRRGPWADGHRAWARLAGWQARPGSSTDGAAALDAMDDIGTLRRLLDQAELAAVRSARRHGRSWAEIATRLGITRQSAWERWRELDDDVTAGPVEPLEAAAGAVLSDVGAGLADEAATEQARLARRRGRVVVPNVVGMTWDDARLALIRAGLTMASADPDGPPLAALGWPNVRVVDQVPEAGAKIPAGSPVRLWLERGGGSAGVREPRRPSPAPPSDHEWRNEPSGEAVG